MPAGTEEGLPLKQLLLGVFTPILPWRVAHLDHKRLRLTVQLRIFEDGDPRTFLDASSHEHLGEETPPPPQVE